MSGGEDGLVNTWRLDHDTGALTQCGQHSPGQGRVTCVSWSRADPGTLVTGGETGEVINNLVSRVIIRDTRYDKWLVVAAVNEREGVKIIHECDF